MASKWIFGAFALIATWIALPSGVLQGEPPAWINAGDEPGFSLQNATEASSMAAGAVAQVGEIKFDEQSAFATPGGAPNGVAPASSTSAVADNANLGSAVPVQPAPMFPAGPSLAAAGDMIGFSRELAGGSQAITLINASRRWMAVYHVDQAGQIRLVSSRPLDADFSFQFNATAPLPEQIRRLQGG